MFDLYDRISAVANWILWFVFERHVVRIQTYILRVKSGGGEALEVQGMQASPLYHAHAAYTQPSKWDPGRLYRFRVPTQDKEREIKTHESSLVCVVSVVKYNSMVVSVVVRVLASSSGSSRTTTTQGSARGVRIDASPNARFAEIHARGLWECEHADKGNVVYAEQIKRPNRAPYMSCEFTPK